MNVLQIKNQEVCLCPDKLVYLPACSTLLVADTHFGKAVKFRKSGIPVPSGTTQMMLNALTDAIRRHRANRLIILGDFVHSATGSQLDFAAELLDWRKKHAEFELTLVRGNHDRGHRSLFRQLNLNVVAEPFVEPPFAFCHYHTENTDENMFTFAGHIHPAISLVEGGNSKLILPCFAMAEHHLILPAFGEFTGCHRVRHDDYQSCFVVADNEVVQLATR